MTTIWEEFVLFINLYGNILNVCIHLIRYEHQSTNQSNDILRSYINFKHVSSIEEYLLQVETCCLETGNMLVQYLTSGIPVFEKQFFHHLSKVEIPKIQNTNVSKIKFRKCIPEILDVIDNVGDDEFLIEFIISDTPMEVGFHVFTLLQKNKKIYLVQSYGDRYQCIAKKSLAHSEVQGVLHQVAEMFDEMNEIHNKIMNWNEVTNNYLSINEYERRLELREYFPMEYPGVLEIKIYKYEDPNMMEILNVIKNGRKNVENIHSMLDTTGHWSEYLFRMIKKIDAVLDEPQISKFM